MADLEDVEDVDDVDDVDEVDQASRVDVARVAYVVGILAAAIGVINGLVIVLDREPSPCTSEAYSAENGTCFDYPHAAEGMALVLVSVMLGAVIVLVGELVRQRQDASTR